MTRQMLRLFLLPRGAVQPLLPRPRLRGERRHHHHLSVVSGVVGADLSECVILILGFREPCRRRLPMGASTSSPARLMPRRAERADPPEAARRGDPRRVSDRRDRLAPSRISSRSLTRRASRRDRADPRDALRARSLARPHHPARLGSERARDARRGRARCRRRLRDRCRGISTHRLAPRAATLR